MYLLGVVPLTREPRVQRDLVVTLHDGLIHSAVERVTDRSGRVAEEKLLTEEDGMETLDKNESSHTDAAGEEHAGSVEFYQKLGFSVERRNDDWASSWPADPYRGLRTLLTG